MSFSQGPPPMKKFSMNKAVLDAINITISKPLLEDEDSKWKEDDEFTHMDWVNKNHDFEKIKEKDLEEVFSNLNARCPKTWTCEFESRAKELNQKFMCLRMGDTAMFVDPEVHQEETKDLELKDNQFEVHRLMTAPESWSMDTRERASEFFEILKHFTMFAPFKGRPFVRAWLEALIPCFSRWILMSDLADKKASDTLKYFLGAFGQPGIVVCLADKGASMLQTLQNAARSVEAIGRGTVERHYWKRLTESACGDPGWVDLASIVNKPLVHSHLDYVPKDWLLDANDWAQIFANVVSPEITERFTKKIKRVINDNERLGFYAGPAKTLARCQAKCREYMHEYEKNRDSPRWSNFEKQFKRVFQREPDKPTDFVWNVVDFARCSITVPEADDVIKVMKTIEQEFSVVCMKNNYNSTKRIKGSGYRDLKLLVEVEFDDLQLGGIPNMQPKTTLLCEVQILCQAWLKNKKSTCLSYEILRAKSLRSLFYDAVKYVKNTNGNTSVIPIEEEVIKNGWINIAKLAKFDKINADELLLTAATKGWNPAGIRMLVKDLNANTEFTNQVGNTPLIMACQNGFDDVAKMLIELGSNIEHRNKTKDSALGWAVYVGAEECVRTLLNAEANFEVKDDGEKMKVNWVLRTVSGVNTEGGKRILKLLRGESVDLSQQLDQNRSKFQNLKMAAVEDELAQFLDVHEVPYSHVSKFLVTDTAVRCLKNLLQILWFGGNIKHKSTSSWTPILSAASHGTVDTLSLLLELGADVNTRDQHGTSPLLMATRYGTSETVTLILEAKADVNVQDDNGRTPLKRAVKFGDGIMVSALLKFGANVDEEVFKIAQQNEKDRETILNLLEEYHKLRND